jgi:hypothetical protein
VILASLLSLAGPLFYSLPRNHQPPPSKPRAQASTFSLSRFSFHQKVTNQKLYKSFYILFQFL